MERLLLQYNPDRFEARRSELLDHAGMLDAARDAEPQHAGSAARRKHAGSPECQIERRRRQRFCPRLDDRCRQRLGDLADERQRHMQMIRPDAPHGVAGRDRHGIHRGHDPLLLGGDGPANRVGQLNRDEEPGQRRPPADLTRFFEPGVAVAWVSTRSAR
jgi:hypothetical protein